MKKLLSTIICVLFCVLSYAQEKEVMYVSVLGGEEFPDYNKHVMEDLFHDLLKKQYEIRLDQGKSLFSEELYNELHYQELGAVSVNKMKEFGLQKGADLLCVVVIESSRYMDERQYYFRAKIYDVQTATLKETASYPYIGSKDKSITYTDINDVTMLQSVAVKLITRLGFKTPDDISNAAGKNKRILKPTKKGGEMRIVSSFSKNGVIGFGFYFHKSYFQLGFDFLLSNELGSSSELQEDDMKYLGHESNQEIIKNDFLLLKQSETQLENGVLKIDSEYIYPRAQFAVSPGLNFKYFSIECGLGAFLCDNLNMTYNTYKSSHSDPQGSKITKSYFLVRPTAVGYIPVSGDDFGLSVSIGYNIVPNASPLNGLIFGLGLFFN